MALINPRKTPEKEKIKIEISKDIYSEIKEYCSWVGIDKKRKNQLLNPFSIVPH